MKPSLWWVLGSAASLLVACVPRGGQQPAYGSPGYAQQVDPTPACQHACYRYFECKGGSAEPAVGAQCVEDCRGSGVDPNAVEGLATADCITVISTFDSGGGPPDGALAAGNPAPSAAPAGAAPGVQPVASAAPATAPTLLAPAPAPAPAPALAPALAPAAVPAAAPPVASSGCGAPGDNPLSQLLVSSAWCYFAYAGGSSGGTTSQERVVFATDGRFAQNGGSESSYSGQQRNQYGDQTGAWGSGGQNSGGAAGCWRADGSALQLTVDGQAYAPIQLSVTRNSNGYPIINAGGKEYYQCK